MIAGIILITTSIPSDVQQYPETPEEIQASKNRHEISDLGWSLWLGGAGLRASLAGNTAAAEGIEAVSQTYDCMQGFCLPQNMLIPGPQSAEANVAEGIVDGLDNQVDNLADDFAFSSHLSPNQIGNAGEALVGDQLPGVTISQSPVQLAGYDRTRRYDGYFFDAGDDYFIEVKTSTRGKVYNTKFIREQLAFDAEFSSRGNPTPTWIFVNSNPSKSLMKSLNSYGIPWDVLHGKLNP